MLHMTDDLRIADLRPLIPPAILMEELSTTEKASTTVSSARDQIRAASTAPMIASSSLQVRVRSTTWKLRTNMPVV
jgi:hypothetical protein